MTRANENRFLKIYEDLAMTLIGEVKKLYANEKDLEIPIDSNVFAIDATTIDLCFSTYYLATFRSTKAVIKLH